MIESKVERFRRNCSHIKLESAVSAKTLAVAGRVYGVQLLNPHGGISAEYQAKLGMLNSMVLVAQDMRGINREKGIAEIPMHQLPSCLRSKFEAITVKRVESIA